MESKFWKQVMVYVLLVGGAHILPLLGFESLYAQDFPTKPVNLVIPFGVGGSSDLTARAIFGTAKEHLGQPLVIRIREGGGGAIGSEEVAQSKPDGYTLLFGHANCQTLLPILEGRSKRADQYEAISLVSRAPAFFIALPDAPFKTFKEMIEYAKANPGKLAIGTPGIWSVTDIMWKAIELEFGLKTRVVHYPGGGQALVAVLGGHVHVTLSSPPQSLPQIKAGKVIPLGFTSDKRSPDLPDLRTVKEQGFDSTSYISWKGILAPKHTPRPIVDKLALAFKKMMEDKTAQPMMKKLAEDYDYKGPDEFTKYLETEFQRFNELVKIIKK